MKAWNSVAIMFQNIALRFAARGPAAARKEFFVYLYAALKGRSSTKLQHQEQLFRESRHITHGCSSRFSAKKWWKNGLLGPCKEHFKIMRFSAWWHLEVLRLRSGFRQPAQTPSNRLNFSAGGTFSSAQTPAERLNFSHSGAGSRSIPGNAEE